jgi:CubicO group peptidase (beta-lactamase class C family)
MPSDSRSAFHADEMNLLKLAFLILCGVFLLSTTVSAQADPIDSYIRAEMAKRHVPGLSLVVIKDKRIIKASNYGLANVELNVAVNERTSFEIASMSKQFTDAAMLLLVEEGKVGLDDSVTKYLDNLPETWRGITIRRLMNHTSGLRDDWDEGDPFFLTNNTNEDFLRALVNFPLKFKPGERFSYSCGPFLIGLVIQKVTGKPYAQFMQERIFNPLGMTSTHINDPFRIIADRASGYVFRDGILKNGVRISPAAEARADVGVATTALDLAKWDVALSGTSLLRESSLREMFSPGRLTDGSMIPYGFGWFITPVRGHLVVGHSGGFRTGFSSTIDRYLDDKLTIIVLANLQTAHAWSIGRTVAGFYNADYSSISFMTPQREPNPQRTLGLQRFLILLSEGRVEPGQAVEHFPLAYYDPEEMRAVIKGMKSFSLVGCRGMSAQRRDLFGARINEICFYKVTADDEHYVSFVLNGDGKVIYVEPYEY